MKKRIVGILLSLVMLFSVTALVLACDNNKKPENVEYSVTVYDPDYTPVADVSVIWKSANGDPVTVRTDTSGKASVILAADTYTVTLDGYPTGYAYTPAAVNAQMKDITILLSPDQIQYTATVKDKMGAPAEGVTVTWVSGTIAAGSALTDAQGVAQSVLGYGDYFVVLSNLPENNVTGGMQEAHGNAPAVNYELVNGVTVSYTVTVRTEGQLNLPKTDVALYNDNGIVAVGKTGDDGACSFVLEQASYRAEVPNLLPGYTGKSASLTAAAPTGVIELHSEVIKDAPGDDLRYVMGDIIHDYEFTTPYLVDGKYQTYKISELLKTKKAILINNWGTNCSYCLQEMPYMDASYQKYKNDIEILAVSNYMGGDSDSMVASYHDRNSYTFPMMRDKNGFTAKFGLSAWPTTVVIDRYGAIARIESGAILESGVWDRLMEIYVADDYVQTFTPGDHTSDSITNEVSKPDVTVPEDHYEKLAEAVNRTDTFPAGASVTYYPETDYEYAWPFLYGTVDGISPDKPVMYSSNSTKPNSMSVLYATVNAPAGSVLTFDYYAETEEGYDKLFVIWDGKILRELDGFTKNYDDDSNDGWKKCYLYSDLISGEHTLIFSYIKDAADQMEHDVYADNVFIRDIRFVRLDDIEEDTNMMRGAAYGVPEENAERFPYYADVALGDDGYYHVDISTLENSEFAGNDDSPLLLANLLNATTFAGMSLYDFVYAVDEDTNEYVLDCNFTVNGKKQDYRDVMLSYFQVATNSDITYCVPVDQDLHDILVELIKRIHRDFPLAGKDSHDDEWLEVCYFYSHYGDGEPVGNPILGLSEKTAFTAREGNNTVDLSRIMMPITSSIFAFTPETSGVYKFESLIKDYKTGGAAQLWLYDDNTSAEYPLAYCGDDYYTRTAENEHNFIVYHYLTAGHTYYLLLAYRIQEVGDDGRYDFTIENMGDTYSALEPCSAQYYHQVEDQYGNLTNEVILAHAIDYRKGVDGYYYAVNDDGSWGSYIYLDIKYPLIVTGDKYAIKDLVNMDMPDPLFYEDGEQHYLDYKLFDFRYKINYISLDNESTGYDPKVDLTELNADKYKDYTAYMKELVKKADENGFVKVDDEVIKALSLYIEMRNNMMLDGQWELPLDNEWLRFCFYYHEYQDYNI